jgi:thymidylate synthase (FAD)
MILEELRKLIKMDKLFNVITLNKTINPQQLIYQAMHQCYSANPIAEDDLPEESKCGEIIVKRLLKGNRGHYGCLEHPSISFNCQYFPHSVIQQASRHRVGISFDVQSFRYTSERLLFAYKWKELIAGDEELLESLIYLRPIGFYKDREGNKYNYSEECRNKDLLDCIEAINKYGYRVKDLGQAPEQARGLLPFDYRQHFVVSFNLRSCLHFLDLRYKKDAQLEIQQLSELIWIEVKNWVPQIADWYEYNRLGKGQLAP